MAKAKPVTEQELTEAIQSLELTCDLIVRLIDRVSSVGFAEDVSDHVEKLRLLTLGNRNVSQLALSIAGSKQRSDRLKEIAEGKAAHV